MSKKERFTLRSAVYLIPIKQNKVLLSRRHNTGWMDGRYSLISGHLDGNESATSAMIREAKEEAGIKIVKKDLKPVTAIHRQSRDHEYIDFFFSVKKWSGSPKIIEPDKCDDLNWFSKDNLPKNTLPYVKRVIKNIERKTPFFEFGW